MKQAFETGYIRKVRDQDLYEFIAFDNINEMFCNISKIYCFDDIDDTYVVIDIFCKGHRVEYVGWRPGMLFEYRLVETGEIAWQGWFEHWDH